MADNRRPETEQQRIEAVRKARQRKALRMKRRRRKQITRLAVYALLAVLAVLLILALVAAGRKLKSSRAEKAIEKALQEEIDNSSLYSASEVLHLSFPVLALDSSPEESSAADSYNEEEEPDEDEEEVTGDDEEENTGEEEETAPAEVVYPKPALTVTEFRRILLDLYGRGYVLVDLYSMTETGEGGYTEARVMVPDGKKPLVLSQFDVSYSNTDDGHATALIKDPSGKIMCSYYNDAGRIVTGAADVVPVLEEFIAQYPDFSYKDARGILGVTGYRGVLGYQIEKDAGILGTVPIEEASIRSVGGDLVGGGTGVEVPEEETDEETENEEEPEENVDADEEETDENDPGQDAEEESEDGQDAQQTGSGADQQSDAVLTDEDAVISSNKKTIEGLFSALRSDGWHIASNSFGLVSYASQYEIMKEDAAKWQELVAPLVGGTDILLLPEKADIAGWSGYTEDNQRYQLLKELGFRQYCMEDEGTFTWAQIRPDYVRQGLHTIENYGDYTALMAAE